MARKIEVEIVSNERGFRLNKTQSSLQKLGKAAGIAGLALGGALVVAAKMGFDELSEGAKVAAQTTAVIKSTGKAANVTAKHVADLSSELSRMSGVDDEVIQSGANLLLTFKNIRNGLEEDEQFFDMATQAALDLSVALGKDMSSSALMVGKALNDPIAGLTALGRAGVQFTAKQKTMIKELVKAGKIWDAQEIILKEIESQVGGSAKAYGETLPAKLQKAKQAFEEVTATMMLALLPAMTKIADFALRVSDAIGRHPKLAKAVTIALIALSAALITASAAQMALNLAMLANPIGALIVGTAALIAVMVLLARRFDFVRRHWQLMLIIFGPGLVLIVTLVKAVIRNFDTFKNILNTVKTKAQAVFSAIRGFVQSVRDAIQRVIDKVQALASKIRDKLGPVGKVVERLAGPFRTLQSIISTIISLVSRLIDLIRRIPTPKIPSFPTTPEAPGVPGRGGGTTMSLPGTGTGFSRTAAAGPPGGLVMVLTTREIANFLQAANTDYRRANGGRSIL